MNLLRYPITIFKKYQFGKLESVHMAKKFSFFCKPPDSIKTAPYIQGYN